MSKVPKKKQKYGDIVSKHVRNPRNIPGIFNYCDRWCERCHMTLRCSVFATMQEHDPEGARSDIANEKFWEKLSEIFQGTIEMIREDAEKKGIDLNCDPAEMDAFMEKQKRREEKAKAHDCPAGARQYGVMVDKWFKRANPLFKEKRVSLESRARMQLPADDPTGEAAQLGDVLEVVQFYQHQIWVKLMRAMDGLLEEEEQDEELKDVLKEYPKDSDGSAKVALIGIDRSISAWSEIRLHFPDEGDKILDILVHLDRLRRKVEKTFPNARAFVRPGFDDRPAQPSSPRRHRGHEERK